MIVYYDLFLSTRKKGRRKALYKMEVKEINKNCLKELDLETGLERLALEALGVGEGLDVLLIALNDLSLVDGLTGSHLGVSLIDLSVEATQSRVEVVIGEGESVDETNSVGTDLLVHDLHDGLAHHRDMLGINVTRGQELAGLLVDLVEGKEVREIGQGLLGGGGEGCGGDALGLGHIATDAEDKVLDEDQLAMSDRGIVDLNEHRVPGALLDIETMDNLGDHVGGAMAVGSQLDLGVVELGGGGGRALKVGVVEVGVQVGQGRVGDLAGGELARSTLGDQVAEGLEQVATGLLGDHVVVSLPGNVGSIVLKQEGKAREG